MSAMIAILDDEPEIRRLLTAALGTAGFETESFGRAKDFEHAIKRLQPDICLVDLGLPDKNGLAVVHKLALEQGASVIIISGRNQVQDRITGLDLGADDYISKPFDPGEVVARVRALLRRGRPENAEHLPVAEFQGWRADFNTFALRHEDGTQSKFSRAESDLLRLFLSAPNRLITRDQMQQSFGGAAGDSFDRAMDVRVSRLRQKLGEDPRNPRLIKTIYGAGYIFVGQVTWHDG